MAKLFYYFIIEVNLNSQTIISNYPEMIKDLTDSKIAMFSSKEYADYNCCLSKLGDTLEDKLDALRDKYPENNYGIYWEKNPFSTSTQEPAPEFDAPEERWLDSEAVKIFVDEHDDDTDCWLFKARVFFRENYHIFPAPALLQ